MPVLYRSVLGIHPVLKSSYPLAKQRVVPVTQIALPAAPYARRIHAYDCFWYAC